MPGAVALRPDFDTPAAARERVAAAFRRQSEAAKRRALHAAEARRQAAAARAERQAQEAIALARAIVERDPTVFGILDPEVMAREPKRIVARTAAAFRVPVAAVTGPVRTDEVVRARWAAIAAVKAAHPAYSLPRLGRLFGRHHTTILHALRAMAERGVPQPPGCAARRTGA